MKALLDWFKSFHFHAYKIVGFLTYDKQYIPKEEYLKQRRYKLNQLGIVGSCSKCKKLRVLWP